MKDETFFDYPVFDNIKQIIYHSVSKYPKNVAFRLKEKNGEEIKYIDITYTEFLEEINRLGTGFYSLGLKGKRVGIIAKNRYEWVLTYVTLLLGGIIAVPFDKGLTDVEIENSILRSKIDAIVYEEKYEDIINKIKNEGKSNLTELICMDRVKDKRYIKDIVEIGKEKLDNGNKDYINCKIDDKALATLVFTSGTTSNSKIVMLSQYNIARNISDMQLVEDFRSTDINLAFLPMHHLFGSTGQLIMLSSGITTAFPDGLRYIAQNLKEYHITFFVGVPILIEAIYKKLNEEIEKKGKTKVVRIAKVFTNLLLKLGIDIRRKVFKDIIDGLGGLRFVISGAAPLDKKVEKGFNDLGTLTVQGYGLTEASPVLCAENYKYRRYGSIGFPMKNVQIRVDSKDKNGIGELVFKAPNIMIGYYEDEEATKEAITKDGYFHSGDIGHVDSEGYVYITGRIKNVIVTQNGKNIYPEEIEGLLAKVPEIKECFVYGKAPEGEAAKKKDKMELIITARVIPNKDEIEKKYGKNLDEKQIYDIIWDKIKEVNKKLTSYKAIKALEIQEGEFEKTSTLKIKRYKEIQKDAKAVKSEK